MTFRSTIRSIAAVDRPNRLPCVLGRCSPAGCGKLIFTSMISDMRPDAAGWTKSRNRRLKTCYTEASRQCAPVAQLDRALASGAKGCRFDPYRARQHFLNHSEIAKSVLPSQPVSLPPLTLNFRVAERVADRSQLQTLLRRFSHSGMVPSA